jgi:hypothetical protein
VGLLATGSSHRFSRRFWLSEIAGKSWGSRRHCPTGSIEHFQSLIPSCCLWWFGRYLGTTAAVASDMGFPPACGGCDPQAGRESGGMGQV